MCQEAYYCTNAIEFKPLWSQTILLFLFFMEIFIPVLLIEIHLWGSYSLIYQIFSSSMVTDNTDRENIWGQSLGTLASDKFTLSSVLDFEVYIVIEKSVTLMLLAPYTVSHNVIIKNNLTSKEYFQFFKKVWF